MITPADVRSVRFQRGVVCGTAKRVDAERDLTDDAGLHARWQRLPRSVQVVVGSIRGECQDLHRHLATVDAADTADALVAGPQRLPIKVKTDVASQVRAVPTDSPPKRPLLGSHVERYQHTMSALGADRNLVGGSCAGACAATFPEHHGEQVVAMSAGRVAGGWAADCHASTIGAVWRATGGRGNHMWFDSHRGRAAARARPRLETLTGRGPGRSQIGGRRRFTPGGADVSIAPVLCDLPVEVEIVALSSPCRVADAPGALDVLGGGPCGHSDGSCASDGSLAWSPAA